MPHLKHASVQPARDPQPSAPPQRRSRAARRVSFGLGLGLAIFAASACSSQSPSVDGAAGAGAAAGAAGLAHAGSSTQGAAGSSGSVGVSGASAVGGSAQGGQTAAGGAGAGTTSAGGATAGNAGSAGSAAAGAAGGPPLPPKMSCGAGPSNQHPFGCKFGWGINTPNGSLASYGYLQLVSTWVGAEVKADGSITSCSACSWLTSNVAPTQLIPVFYAYFIGFYGHANGLVDGNQTGSKKLTTEGAALIKANRAKIVDMHAWYAKEVHKVWPTKPLVWLLDGDYVQYTDSAQGSPLTMDELGQLAADITCAIKSNMPNAVVAIDHSSWNSDQVTTSFWSAMNRADYDLVWTTGVGNNHGYLAGDTTSKTYNSKTATYAFLHQFTQRPILVDTSAGASAAGDSWSTASASDINARIADGVIAADITGTAPNGLQSNITALGTLNAIPACP